MNRIRARFKAVIISVLLLAIILCSIVLYTMETGRTPTVQAVSTTPSQGTPIVATPVSMEETTPIEPENRTIELTVDGNTVTVTSQNHTVADFLEIVGIELGDEYIISHSLDSTVAGGANIDVARTLHKEITEFIDIPYETEYIEDEEMYEGNTEVEQYGYEGVTVETYDVTLHGGKEESKNLIASEIQYEPQNEIIRYGTKVYEEPVYEEPEVVQETQTEPATTVADTSEVAVPSETAETPAEVTPTTDRTFANDYQRYAYEQCITTYGWSESDFDSLVALWNRESQWNPNVVNPYTGCAGIPQALPGHNLPSDYYTNGYSQVDWGLGYISGQYGNPSVALNHSYNKGWY